MDIGTGQVRDLTEGRYPRYSATGHLLFQDATESTLLVARFDAESLELAGAPLPLVDGLISVGASPLGINPGSFAVSGTGRLIYRVGSSIGTTVVPTWVERDGVALEIDPEWSTNGIQNRSSLALSPDGSRLAISILDSGGRSDLWMKQLDNGPLARLTFEGTINHRPAWSPDGQWLTFQSNRSGGGLWTQRADGSGTAELLVESQSPSGEGFYSPDGTMIVFRTGTFSTADILAIRPQTDSVPSPLVVTEFSEHSPTVSPDGRWLAYASDQSGRDEVYVRPFPEAASALTQVSTEGGTEPVWARSGRELFYRNGDNELVAVQLSAGPSFAWDRQDVLFSMADYLSGNRHPQYDVSPDDRRFVMLRIAEQARTDSELILVDNWAEELTERVANP